MGCVCVYFFFPCHMASDILVLWPGIETMAHGIESTWVLTAGLPGNSQWCIVKYSIIWLHHSDSIYCCWAIRLFLILTIVSNMLCTLLYTSSGTHMHAHSVSLNLSNYCWIVFHGASPVHILINSVWTFPFLHIEYFIVILIRLIPFSYLWGAWSCLFPVFYWVFFLTEKGALFRSP